MSDITEDDILKAIADAMQRQDDPGLESGCTTTPRVMERFKISRPKARRFLNKLIIDRIIVADKITNVDMWGNAQTISGFRWIGNKK